MNDSFRDGRRTHPRGHGSIAARRWQAFVVALIASAALAAAVSADSIQKWKTPSGQLYFGDHPPPGSTKVGEEKDTAPPAAAEAARAASGDTNESPEHAKMSVDASQRRTQIERALNRDAERLAEVRKKISDAQSQPNVLEPWMEKGLGLPNEKGDSLKQLRAEQGELAAAMVKHWDEFDELDKKVRESFGGSAPDWWRKPSCSQCPSRSELAGLAKQ
jgi:hypothetical protein